MRLVDLRFVLAASFADDCPRPCTRSGRPTPRTISSSPTATTSRCRRRSSRPRTAASTSAGSTTRRAATTSTCSALDAGGNEHWAHNGVLVADRDMSSTEDYGLDIDADGNALLAFGYHRWRRHHAGARAESRAGRHAALGRSRHLRVDRHGRHGRAENFQRDRRRRRLVAWTSSEGSVAVQKLDGDGNPALGRARNLDRSCERLLLHCRSCTAMPTATRSSRGCHTSASRMSSGRRSLLASMVRISGVPIRSRCSTARAAHCSSAISRPLFRTATAARYSSGTRSARRPGARAARDARRHAGIRAERRARIGGRLARPLRARRRL